jgi:hypothetical protein
VKLYPIVFSFRDPVVCNGFVAAVAMDGCALLSEEDDQEVWVYGVQPGGLAGGGAQRAVALNEFKKGYMSVLFDIASEATSFVEFKAAVTAFFSEVNEVNQAEWTRALEAVRKNNISLTDLQSVKAETRPPNLTVEEMPPARANSAVNQFDQYAEAA